MAVISGGQTLLALTAINGSGAQAVPIHCTADNTASFNGDRVSGQLNGTFHYVADSACDSSMVELDVYADLLKDGTSKSNTGHATCNNCLAVNTGTRGEHDCRSCGGVWRVQSTHVFTYPGAFALVDYDAGRCTIISPVQVSCIVKSNKVRM